MTNSKVAVLHGEVPPDAAKDEQDVLTEVETVSESLRLLNYEPIALPLSLNLEKAKAALRRLNPAFVFNLVESINGAGQLIYLAPALLDHLRLPYTGSSTNAIYVTTNKLLTKERLRTANLSTPAWAASRQIHKGALDFPPPYLIKPNWEDASVGLDEAALVYEQSGFADMFAEREHRFGECFLEAYVEGREFNISLLAGDDGPAALPPAEIVFQNYPETKPKLVDYQAKWITNSFEYRNTVRTFKFPKEDADLLFELKEIALLCWELFELRGYARVDFRVDAAGKPWVLEVNANPCISPDGGLAAAAGKAGLNLTDLVSRIISDLSGMQIYADEP